MNHKLTLSRATFLALALGTGSLSVALAQTSPTNTPPSDPAPLTPASGTTPNPAAVGKGKKQHEPVLTPAEREQLNKDQARVLAANPDMQAEKDAIEQQKIAYKNLGSSATPQDRKTLTTRSHAFQKKLQDEVVKIDPSASDIYAKLLAARKAKHAAANT